MTPILYISMWMGGPGVATWGRGWPQKRRLLKGVIMPEETWGDNGRHPLIKSENRGDVVYGWSPTVYRKSEMVFLVHAYFTVRE